MAEQTGKADSFDIVLELARQQAMAKQTGKAELQLSFDIVLELARRQAWTPQLVRRPYPRLLLDCGDNRTDGEILYAVVELQPTLVANVVYALSELGNLAYRLPSVLGIDLAATDCLFYIANAALRQATGLDLDDDGQTCRLLSAAVDLSQLVPYHPCEIGLRVERAANADGFPVVYWTVNANSETSETEGLTLGELLKFQDAHNLIAAS